MECANGLVLVKTIWIGRRFIWFSGEEAYTSWKGIEYKILGRNFCLLDEQHSYSLSCFRSLWDISYFVKFPSLFCFALHSLSPEFFFFWFEQYTHILNSSCCVFMFDTAIELLWTRNGSHKDSLRISWYFHHRKCCRKK